MKARISSFLFISCSFIWGMEQIVPDKEEVSWAVTQCTNLKYRKEQQDGFSHASIGRNHLFGVYDGHGGKEVSQFLGQQLSTNFKNSDGSVQDKFKRALLLTEQHIFDNAAWDRIGSTVVMVYIDIENRIAHFANVGDSRAVLEKDEQLEFETNDHKPSRMDEFSRIMEKGGIVDMRGYIRKYSFDDCGLAMSRSIGDKIHKTGMNNQLTGAVISEPELYSFCLTPKNKFLVLATDGLWDVFSSSEVIEVVCKADKVLRGLDAEELKIAIDYECEKKDDLSEDGITEKKSSDATYLDFFTSKLCRKTFGRGSQDNITIALLRLNWDDESQ